MPIGWRRWLNIKWQFSHHQHAGIYTLLGLFDDNDVISNYYDSGAESNFDSIDEANWPESEESIQDSDSTEGREIKKVSLLVADVF